MECLTRYGKPKKQYETENEAIRIAEEMEDKHHEPFNVYQCQECNCWHVGRENGVKRMDEKEKRQLAQYRRNVENPPYQGVRTKRDLKNKVLIENTERIVKEEVR